MSSENKNSNKEEVSKVVVYDIFIMVFNALVLLVSISLWKFIDTNMWGETILVSTTLCGVSFLLYFFSNELDKNKNGVRLVVSIIFGLVTGKII